MSTAYSLCQLEGAVVQLVSIANPKREVRLVVSTGTPDIHQCGDRSHQQITKVIPKENEIPTMRNHSVKMVIHFATSRIQGVGVRR